MYNGTYLLHVKKCFNSLNNFKGWNIQVSQVPESSEGIFGRSLYLITLNEPVEDNEKAC